MHFMVFDGVVPKIAPKTIKEQNSVIAENLDLYGTRFLPHKEVGETQVLLDVRGNEVTGRVETIHQVGNTLVAFPVFTSVANDPVERLGRNSFLFVEDGVLYRQSEARILQKKPPMQVGIARPECKTEPKAEVVSGAGCKEEQIEQICPMNTDENCNTDGYPPQITAYKFTYVNACGEESADSMPSNYVEVQNGDAVKLTVDDTPPANAVKRRWYRVVADDDGVAHWLYVGTSSITENVFYDTTCPLSWGSLLESELDNPPPMCIDGVANIGNLRTILWGGNKLYVSPDSKPHAYPQENQYELRYNVLRLDEVTEKMEGAVSYQVLALTDGLHYRITYDGSIGISELEVRLPCQKPEHAYATEVAVYYLSTMGLCEFTVQGIKMVTGEYFTEREWAEWVNHNSRPVYHDDRVFVFGDKSFIIGLGGDERRTPSVSTLSTTWDIGYSTIDNQLLVYKQIIGHKPFCRWWATGQERMCGVWRSKPIMMSGFWRPVAIKVISPEYAHKSYKAVDIEHKFKIWLRTHPGLTIDDFLDTNPEYEQYRAELTKTYPSIEVVLFADGKEYYRRSVSSGRPYLIPRKYKALDWQIEVRSKLVIDEIHIQTSRTSLLSEG